MAEYGSREIRAWLALNAHPEVGAIRFHRLLEAFGSAEQALGKSAAAWSGLGLRWKSDKLSAARKEIEKFDTDRELELIEKLGLKVLRFHEESYPLALQKSECPPPLLYVKGELRPDEPAMAVVGTRRMSEYGRDQAIKFSKGLASAGLAVVSGLALGVDAVAHQAVIEQGGRTVAVMGRGLADIYPSENAHLADRIFRSGGALVSQFAIETGPQRYHFPMRNRVVAGLCLGVMVIEGSVKSGAMITASDALDLNREVFAVPGPVDSTGSEGPHRLIQQGAKLTQCLEDVLEELRGLPPRRQIEERPVEKNEIKLPVLTGEEANLAGILGKRGPLDMDALALESGLAPSSLASVLTMMEIKGAVKQRPGKVFESLRRQNG